MSGSPPRPDFSPIVSAKEDSPGPRIQSPHPTGSSTGSTFLFITGLSIFVAILFHEVLLGDLLFWLDTHLTFEPLFGQLGESLPNGRLLWSSLLETGKPILANPTQAALYPLNLLFSLLPAPRAISVLTVIHILIGSIGAFFLATRLGLRNHPALLSGLLFAGAGATLSGTPYIGLSWCTTWLPWLIFFCDCVSRREHRLRSTFLLGFVVLMMLTIAEPFVLVAAGLGVVLWLVGDFRSSRASRGERIPQHLHLLVLAAAAAVIAASPYLLAVAFNLPHSVRALGFTWDGVTIWSLHPLRLFECLAPGVFGYLGKTGDASFWATGMVPIKGFPYLASLYIGAPAIALMVAGVVKQSPRRTTLSVWLAALVLLSLGRWGPFYPLFEGAPGLDAARYPVKWLVPAIVPLCLLAGMGMRNVIEPRDANCRRVFLIALTSSVVALLAVATAVHFSWLTRLLEIVAMKSTLPFSPETRETVVFACIRGLVPAVVVIGLFRSRDRLRSHPRTTSLALSLVVAADLVTANTHLVETTDAEFFEREPRALQIVRSDPMGFDRIRIDENSSGVSRWASGNPTLLEISLFQREILAGYVAARFGVPSALTRDTEATGPAGVYSLRVLGESAPPREQAMVYGSASITHLVTDRGIDHPAFHRLDTARTIAGTSIHVYRNRLARPRVSVIHSVIPYNGDDGYRKVVRDSGSDLFSRAALVDAEDLQWAPPGFNDLIHVSGHAQTDQTGTARIVEDRGHRMTIETETATSAVLVLSDAYSPQWSARVDGLDTPLLRVNYCFRGVFLNEGRHTLVLEYDPWQP